MSAVNNGKQGNQHSPEIVFLMFVLVMCFLAFLFWYTQHNAAVKTYVFLTRLLVWPLYWIELGQFTNIALYQFISSFTAKVAGDGLANDVAANFLLAIPSLALAAVLVLFGENGNKLIEKIDKNNPFIWMPSVISNAIAFVIVTLLLMRFLGIWQPTWFASTSVVLDTLSYMKANPDGIESTSLLHLANIVGRLYYAPLIALVTIYVMRAKNHPRNKHRFAYNIDTFLKDMTQEFKAAIPVLKYDPIDKEIAGYEPSRSASAYAKKNALYIEKFNRFDVGAMQKLFVHELGKKFMWATTPENSKSEETSKQWTVDKNTFSNMTDWQKAIFAILASVIATREKVEGFAIRDAINASGEKTDVNLSLALPLLKKYWRHPEVVKVIKGHNYINTVLMEMFVSVREWTLDLHPAQFIWLKPIHRPFWYAQHCTPLSVDRIDFAAFAEGLSIISQWQCERVCKANNGYYHFDFPPFQISAAMGLINEMEKTGIDARVCKLAKDECWNIFANPFEDAKNTILKETNDQIISQSQLVKEQVDVIPKNMPMPRVISNIHCKEPEPIDRMTSDDVVTPRTPPFSRMQKDEQGNAGRMNLPKFTPMKDSDDDDDEDDGDER